LVKPLSAAAWRSDQAMSLTDVLDARAPLMK
jgi:hypothetical protein